MTCLRGGYPQSPTNVCLAAFSIVSSPETSLVQHVTTAAHQLASDTTGTRRPESALQFPSPAEGGLQDTSLYLSGLADFPSRAPQPQPVYDTDSAQAVQAGSVHVLSFAGPRLNQTI